MLRMVTIVTKVLRVKDGTFEELVKHGRWDDTMDTIVSRILEQVKESCKQ